MTQLPSVEPPEHILVTALEVVRATVDDALRLGLSWRLRPGTVGGDDGNNAYGVPVRIDGDTGQLIAQSMIGVVPPGQRVWCVQVPPAGVYVIGYIGTDPVADDLAEQIGWTQTGVASVSFSSLTSHTMVVPFAHEFPAEPVVEANINVGAGATSRWSARAINITSSQFTLFVYSNDPASSTWSSIPVGWSAIYRP